MDDFVLWNMGGSALVGLILQVIKKLWVDKDGEPVLQDRTTVIAALLLGVALAYLAGLARIAQAGEVIKVVATWVWALNTFGQGFMSGLAACGIYSALKSRTTPIK